MAQTSLISCGNYAVPIHAIIVYPYGHSSTLLMFHQTHQSWQRDSFILHFTSLPAAQLGCRPTSAVRV